MSMLAPAVVTAAGAVFAFVHANSHGGSDAQFVVSAQVVTGTALYGVSSLLAIASLAFFCSAVTRSTQVIAGGVATCALFGAVCIAGISPEIVADLAVTHGWFSSETLGR